MTVAAEPVAGRRRVLVTGGAGFVGSNLALGLAQSHPEWELLALDNLHRRGSELNARRLESGGVALVRADVREPQALRALPALDAIVECSAEPSTAIGVELPAEYGFHTNVTGAFNCLELARRDDAQLVFLSTSRVYPYPAVNSLAYEETETRFSLSPRQQVPGASPEGVSERFPLAGPRTLYGASKLAAELLVTEYAATWGVRTVIDRCSVIAGPWQLGRVDQGVFTHWLLCHHFRRPLSYIGHGGSGKQLRDLLHVDDLVELIDEQLLDPERWAGETFNVGGGRERSLSLLEATRICRELTGNEISIGSESDERHGDVRIYVSDCRALFERTSWRPRRDARQTLASIAAWIREAEPELAGEAGIVSGAGEGGE